MQLTEETKPKKKHNEQEIVEMEPKSMKIKKGKKKIKADLDQNCSIINDDVIMYDSTVQTGPIKYKILNGGEYHVKKKVQKRKKDENINGELENANGSMEAIPIKKKKNKCVDYKTTDYVENGFHENKNLKKFDDSNNVEKTIKKFVPKTKFEDKNGNFVNTDDVIDVSGSSDDDDPGSFRKFSISNFVANKLREQGIKKLFPVQYESYNDIMNGTDVIVQSRTGSGKTLSFGIPLIEKIHASQQSLGHSNNRGRPPQALVLTPTRELSKQVSDCISSIANDRTTVLCVYGGTPVYPQERALKDGVDILVGTPGRIQDLIDRGSCNLSSLKHVVLDEVDRMLDMGFADDVDKILQIRYSTDGTKDNPQTLFFSATLPSWVQQTASKYLNNNVKKINMIKHNDVKTSKTVQHLAIQCSYQDRAATINSVVRVYSGNQGKAMIFCKTKKDADELALSSELTIDAHVIHGDVPQEKREMVLKCFREGKYRCLIATDVAARGLDIPEVDLVIQCSPPQDVESYIHRSGRTGRAGKTGTCVLFFKRYEERELRMVEQRANIKLKIVGPPTPNDIMKAAAEDAARIMASVSKEASNQFVELAEQLIEERGAVTCLSEALAVISGNQEIKQRSLLSSKEGMVTFVYRTKSEIRYLTFFWNALQRFIDQNLKEAITGTRFCKDRQGVAFDVPAERAAELESLWVDGNNDTLRRAETLPELEQQANNFQGNRFQDRRGNFNDRGGFRGNRGGSRYGGNFRQRNY